MSNRNLMLIVFSVAVAAQLAVPAWMIAGRERTMREGKTFKFRTRPVDPVDAFRGRYVWLSLEPGSVKVQDADKWMANQKAYAVLGTDSNGFAVVNRLDRAMPAGEPAVKVRVRWPNIQQKEVRVDWPGLDRYYMTEKKAPAAERAYWQHNVRTNRTCHVTVRVSGNDAVIENLFIEEKPVSDWLKENAAR
jgi:uncharacterized membrane-anchored protein